MLVRPPSEVIAAQIRGVDRVHVFDKYGRDSGWRGLSRLADGLRAEAYELALIPHPSIRSTLLAYLAKIPRRVGNAGGLAGLFLTQRFRAGSEDSFTGQRLRLIDAEQDDPGLHGTMARDAQNPRTAEKYRLGLLMGSAWATKCWSKAQARRLLDDLDPAQFEVVFLGAEWERDRFEGLFDANVTILDRIGQPLGALVDELAACDLVLGGDTGPLHIARSMSVPVIGLFGPTSEHRHDFSARDVVLSEELACRPCSAHGDKKCPLQHHQCMVDLDANRVKNAILSVLD